MIIHHHMEYIRRAAEAEIARRLRQAPVLVLTGARQTGKSTLVQRSAIAAGRTYRTLDDLDDLALAKRRPEDLLADHGKVTIDEVQRAPSLLLAIKRAVDRAPRSGRFLLTGSANLLLMQSVAESLAGRAQYMTLWPLTDAECRREDGAAAWRSLCKARDAQSTLAIGKPGSARKLDLDAVLLRGGYPPAVQRDDEARALWFDGYVRTYLERDLQQLSQIDALADFRRLMRVSALRIGGMVNQADLARDSGLSPATAHRYLNLLETSYQVHRLPAFAVNRTKRLIKAPKLYWTDTGLAAFLAGVEGRPSAERRAALMENLVLCQLLAWRELEVRRPEISYWRTAAGEEVDFVIEWQNRVVPIEVKSGTQPRLRDARNLEAFVSEYQEQCRFGVILFDGNEPRLLTKAIAALPLAWFA